MTCHDGNTGYSCDLDQSRNKKSATRVNVFCPTNPGRNVYWHCLAQFMQRDTSEETLVRPIRGAFGAVQGGPEVRKADMVITTAESLSDSSSPKWKIAGMLSHNDSVQEGQRVARTLMYIVYAHNVNSGLYWSSTCVSRALKKLLRDVSIPNHVRELYDCCFQGCRSLCRVTFGSSSSIERIGVSCFKRCGVEEVNIPTVFVICVMIASKDAGVFVA